MSEQAKLPVRERKTGNAKALLTNLNTLRRMIKSVRPEACCGKGIRILETGGRMRLVIELPDLSENPDMATLDEHQAGILFRDALGEFMSSRIPMQEYVNRRYVGQSEDFKQRKLQEVSRRVVWAALIKSGSVKLEK